MNLPHQVIKILARCSLLLTLTTLTTSLYTQSIKRVYTPSDKTIIYSFGSYLNNVSDMDGRIPFPLEVGAFMGNYIVSLQSDVRRGRTYISNMVSTADQMSIDTRYTYYQRTKKLNHFVGVYGQFTTTAMAVDGAALGMGYRYFDNPSKKIFFFAEALLPIVGFNKIRRWNPDEERINAILFGINLNPEYKARNTEIRLKVGLIIRGLGED
jgi:hypothetical protein